MKVRVLKLTDREIKLEIENDGHTFLGALQDVLMDDRRVEFVGYNIPHPLIPKATFTLRVIPGSSVSTVLKDGIENFSSRLKEFETLFCEAYKKSKS